MGCCGLGIPEFKEEKPLIVDVYKYMRDKAWNNYKYSFGYFGRKCLKRSNFTIEVPGNFFVFEQIQQEITDPGRGIKTSEDGAVDTRDMLQGHVPPHRESNPEAICLDTMFSNDTAKKQTYQFKFSKTRTTSIQVSYQKGFMIGGKTSFSIGAPKILGGGELGLEAEMQYNITNSKEQNFEESMNMETTSDIAVGPKSTYVASIEMEERKINMAFRVITRMSMPQGRAPIYIRRKNSDKLAYAYYLNNLKDLFGGEEMCLKVKEGEKFATDKIDFVIEGHMKGSLALDHRINLTSDETEEEKTFAKNKQLQIGDED